MTTVLKRMPDLQKEQLAASAVMLGSKSSHDFQQS
jgi:hypothetical protein